MSLKMKYTKIITLFSITILLTSLIPLAISDELESRAVIYVDDDAISTWYDATHVRTIQEGIDNATMGDTIYVLNGFYSEHIRVNKTVTIQGENKTTTILDAGGNNDAIQITSPSTTITNLTIRNAGSTPMPSAIVITSDNNTISNNIITANPDIGIKIDACTDNTISNNIIKNNGEAIRLWQATYTSISNNNLSNNQYGLKTWYGSHNDIIYNSMNDNSKYGVYEYQGSHNTFSNNIITDSTYGLRFDESTFQLITNNIITGHSYYGIRFNDLCDNNTIYNNYFDNALNANSSGIDTIWNTSLTLGTNIINGSYIGGNYWSDYTGYDLDGDGIGETPYMVYGGISADYFPLTFLNNPPNANFTFSPLSPTILDTIIFTDTSSDPQGSNDIINWTWDFGDGNNSYQQNATHSYDTSGIFNVSLTVKDSRGVSDSTYQLIPITNIGPIASFTYEPTIPNTHDLVYLNSTSTDADGTIVNWTWDFDDGNLSYGKQVTHSFNQGIYNVVLYIVDDDGATNFTMNTISVINIQPTVDFTFIPIDPTTQTLIQFIDQSSDRSSRSVLNWTWDFGDGNTSFQQNPTHNYPDDGTYVVSLTITDDDGASNVTSKNVTVQNMLPTANFSFMPTNATTEDIITFTDSSTDIDGIIANWSWNFGDGNTSIIQHPTHSYAENGTYFVTLTVTDDDNATHMVTKQISLANAIPQANFTFLPVTPITFETIQFNDTSTDSDGTIISWQWDFDDGTNSSLQHPTHNYSDDGNYLVSLTVTDNDGAIDTEILSVEILNREPIASFSFSPLHPPSDEFISFSDSSIDLDGIIVNWTWDFDDGTTSYAQHPNHQYLNHGLFNVTLTITDDDNATDSISMIINVTNAYPKAIFTWNPTMPTTQDIVNFVDLSYDHDGSITSWYWDFGDGNYSAAQYPNHLYADDGVYTVTLTIADNDGAINTTTQTIEIHNVLPTANYSLSTDLALTFETISFTDSSTDIDGIIINWTWVFDDGTMSYLSNPTHQYTDDGVYTVNLTITDDDGDSVSKEKTVTILNREPNVYFNYSPINITTYEPIHFTDLSMDLDGTITSWYWDFDDSYFTSAQHPTHYYTDDGVYTVTLTITDDDGAINTTNVLVNVTNQPPTSSFSYSPGSPSTIDLITFTDTSTDTDGIIVNWNWDLGDGNTSNAQHPTHSYTSNDTFTVTLTITDDDNETNTSTQFIHVNSSPTCFNTVWVDDDFNSSLWGFNVYYFDNIQDAVDAVCVNGTIHVAEGTYPETINLREKPLSIIGAAMSTVVINASSFSGYGINNFGDFTLISDLTFIGTTDPSAGYGFKVSGARNITLTNITIQDSSRTGLDLNGVETAQLTNIYVGNSINGFGIMILDSNQIQLEDISTAGNGWGGVAIQSNGAYYPGGCDNISFTGSFTALELVSLMKEKDPPYYYDITNVILPTQYNYVVYGYRESDDYMQWFYQESLTEAKTFAESLLNSTMFTYDNILIHDLTKENYYIIPGLIIQNAINDATDCDHIIVDRGNYTESFYTVGKSLSFTAPEGATIICPSTPHDVKLAESTETYEYGIGLFGGTYTSSNDTVWGEDTITVSLEGFTIDANNHNPSDRWSSILMRNVNSDYCDGISEISNNTIEHIFVDGDETFGILGYGLMDIQIKNNLIDQFGRGGIGLYGGHADIIDNTVIGNRTTTWATNGIQLGYGASGLIIDNDVSECGWPGSNWSGTGIMVVDTTSVSIQNNHIHDSEQAIAVVEYFGALTGDVTISGNTINATEWGLSISNNVNNVSVLENSFLDVMYDAIDVYNYSWNSNVPTNITVHYNNIIGSGADGLWIGDYVTDIVDATCNWWGDISGPHNNTNPDGIGDNITGNAFFEPWLDDAYPDGDCVGGLCTDPVYVDDDASSSWYDWSHVDSIQTAVDRVCDGGTIYVEPGSYAEDTWYGTYMYKEVTLLGPNAGVCGTDPRDPEAIIHYPIGLTGTGNDWACVLYIEAENVTIDGFTITDDEYNTSIGYAYFTGVYAVDSNNTVISNNIFEGFNYISALLSGGGGYPSLMPNYGAQVECNFVKDNYGLYHALYLQGVGGTVTGNTVDDCGGALQIQPYSQPIGGIVTNNDFSGHVNGIYYNYANMGAGKWYIEENEIHRAAAPSGSKNFNKGNDPLDLSPIDSMDLRSGVNWSGLYLRTYGNSGTGSAPEVEFNNNNVDGFGATDPYWNAVRAVQIRNINGAARSSFYGNNLTNTDTAAFVYTDANVTSVSFHQNNLVTNLFGIDNFAPQILNATCNWWDDSSGPYHSIENSGGLGSEVSDNVTFLPWLTDLYPEGDCNGGFDELDVNQSIFDRGFPIRHAIDGDWAASQSFLPTTSVISQVEIYLRAFGTPEFNLTIELRENHPQGSLIDTLTFIPSEIPTSWTWQEIDFTDTTITPGTEYFIVIPPAPSGVATSFGYEWAYAFGDQYSDGVFWFTRDGGDLWRDLPSMYDFTFRTYGCS